jgi:hypothetical protein
MGENGISEKTYFDLKIIEIKHKFWSSNDEEFDINSGSSNINQDSREREKSGFDSLRKGNVFYKREVMVIVEN